MTLDFLFFLNVFYACQQLDERDDSVAALSLEVESLRQKARTRDQEAADLRLQLVTSQDALQRATDDLRSCQRELREWVRASSDT